MGEEGVRCDRGTRGTPGSDNWLPIASPRVVCGVGDTGWGGQLSERNPMQKRFLKTDLMQGGK